MCEIDATVFAPSSSCVPSTHAFGRDTGPGLEHSSPAGRRSATYLHPLSGTYALSDQ